MVPVETYYEVTSHGAGDVGEEEVRKGMADDDEESNVGIEVKVVAGPDKYEGNEEEGGERMAGDNGESNTGVEVVVASPDQPDPDPEDGVDDEEQKPNGTGSGSEIKSTQDDDVAAAASDALDQPDSPTKSKKKRKKKSGKNVSTSASSLVDEKSSKDTKTKKKKKETTEKKEKSEKKLKTEKKGKSEKKEKSEKKLKTEKKEKSGTEKKPKSEKKLKKTKTKKKKKKGDSSKGDTIEGTTGLSISASRLTGDDDGDNDDSAAADDTHTPSGTSEKKNDSDIVEDGVKQHASMMTKLRQAEKARESQQAGVYPNDDSDDEGLWACTDKDSKRNDEGESVASEDKDKMKKMNQKSEWVSSVEADETASFLGYDSDDSGMEGSLRDDSSRRPSSMSSILSDASDRSSSIRSYRSSKSASARSYRSSGSNSRRSRSSHYTFRDLKGDRNSSVMRSIKGEETKDNASVASEGTDKTPLSQVELRKDLQAQALERLENSSTGSDTDELIAVLRKSTGESKSRLTGAAKLPSVYEDGEGGSDNESDDGGKESEKGFDDEEDIEKGGKSKGDKKKKKDLRQKWLAFKQKAMSRKGYIVLVSVLISLFVIANIVLIVFLA